jgi:hypothetical protein
MRITRLVSVAALISCSSLMAAHQITGNRKVWYPVTLTFDGPESSEDASPNPFRDFRLNVEFMHGSGIRFTVPGYFAADGNAAESSARSGNKWRVHFTPNVAGEWRFTASFRQGSDAAISMEPNAGSATAFDGESGSFQVEPADRLAPGFHSKGMLHYSGGHYLRHAGNGEYYLKGGADSPENFLAYYGFDDTFDTDATFAGGQESTGTPFVHRYEPHAADWRKGDPDWKDGRGRNIIGALNYLSSKAVNSVYFLTYNIDGGDGRDTWMWTSPQVRDRYDVSKLAQWEIVFTHMDARGMQLHVITQETENDRALGGSAGLNPVRKLYHRELIARFSHHLALIWNQGEENNVGDHDRKEIARHIRALDPYQHPITVHTKNNRALTFYDGLLGDGYFEATSIQSRMESYNQEAIELRRRSAESGRPWVIFSDEQAPAAAGVVPDSEDPAHDGPRKLALWGNLMGGGAGVEWYFGYKFPHMDINCEDFRSRDRMWDQTRHALQFFRTHLRYWEMAPDNSLITGPAAAGAYVFAKPGSMYAVYLPNGGTPLLTVAEGAYMVRWYNPRSGGNLALGSLTVVQGPGERSLGPPPADRDSDWVVLVSRAAAPKKK